MPSPPPNGSNLCLPCGLCCDGSLFERARLQAGEESFATSLGMAVLDKGGGFYLPCPLFKSCCTIYNQPRPAVCADFKCKLLRNYENGQIGLSESLEKVQRARAMQSELVHLLPQPVEGLPSLAEAKRQMQILTDAGQRRAHLGFLLLAAKYEMFLRSHFLRRLPKNLSVEKLPGMGE
jgi:uncharacterized protein